MLVPVTVRGLGTARFGLLALAWAIAEGTGVFDFGLGRATVRFVADATAREAARVREVVLASLFFQTIAGLAAGALLFALTDLIVTRAFHIAAAQRAEATAMFRVVALQVPVLLALGSLRSSLEGAQRFDLSTALRIPSSIASVAVPAFAASAGYSLPRIMWLLLAVRGVLALVSAYAVRRTLLPGGWGLPAGFTTLREMLSYSGWVAVSTVIGPIFSSFDRFVLSSVRGTTALGLYTGAAEAANRFLLIPASAFAAILPALAASDARGDRAGTLGAARAARRQLAALLLPPCLILLVFGPVLLGLWLGPDFAASSGLALRILAVGIFLTGLSHIPLALLYGSNRPDMPAKVHIVEAIVHITLTIVLVKWIGITGAAIATGVRCAEDLLLYEWAARRSIGRPQRDVGESRRVSWLIVSAGIFSLALLIAVALRPMSVAAALATIGTGLAAYSLLAWNKAIAANEKQAWRGLALRIQTSSR